MTPEQLRSLMVANAATDAKNRAAERAALDTLVVVAPTPPPAPPVSTVTPILVDWIGNRKKQVWAYTDDDLKALVATGINGLAIGMGWLPGNGVGGTRDDWAIVPTNFCARARDAGMQRIYLTVTSGNYNDPSAPFADWFGTDSEWAGVLDDIAFVSTRAKELGADGIGWDNEEYAGVNGRVASWAVNYPGNTHAEADVRAKVRSRGVQIIQAIINAFPGCATISYHDYFEGGASALTQHLINGAPLDAPSKSTVTAEFWDGYTAVPGRGAVHFMDASFYFGSTLTGYGYDDTKLMALNRDGTMATITSKFACQGEDVFVSPMGWLAPTKGDGSQYVHDHCPTPARSVAIAQAARATCMDGVVFNYSPDDPITTDVHTGAGCIQQGDFGPALLAAAGIAA